MGTGRSRASRFRLWTQILLAALPVSVAHAQSAKSLWVIQAPDEIVEYDSVTFAVRRTVKVPRRVVEHPELVSINARGQMVFLPPRGSQWGAGELASTADRAWFWDGRQAKEWKLEGPRTSGRSGGKPTVTETARQWFLCAAGDALLWFENTFEKVTDESGGERSQRSTAKVWQTDLAGGAPKTIATLPTPEWCECTTGVCSESCPEWTFWAPDGLVGDFFLVTRMTPGQLESTYHESLVYHRSAAAWQARKLPRPVERALTGSDGGAVLVAAVPDGGCCGWENESSDQTLLLSSEKTTLIFDEFGRYDNRNYDVSFYTADARLAPGRATLAYTIVSTAHPDGQIRPSSDGKENATELARVRKAIAELPAVEIVEIRTSPRPAATIRRAGLVGWLNDGEVLVAQDGRLRVYDVRGTKRRETAIRVRSAADAFLR